MDLNKCVKCGKLFSSNEDICPSCAFKDIKDLAKVRKFVLDNPNITTLEEISINTEVSKSDILRYINNGRFDDISYLGNFFKCLYCNTPIKKGKYCDNCLAKFSQIKERLIKNQNNQ